ncbi:hypothetical protein C8R42DRAFT_557006, partial [Lentinula raphanica]
KTRALPEGMGSLGTRALRMKASVNSPSSEEIEARLDSGADITLMSEDYYLSRNDLSKLKSGLRMNLYHLMGEAKVLGYVRFPLYAQSKEGPWLCFDTEAYVVRNMKVPLLLGEDFQTSYELQVSRDTFGNCSVSPRNSTRTIRASSAKVDSPGFEWRQAFPIQSFVRRHAARRERKRRRKNPDDLRLVRAAKDIIVGPGAVHSIPVTGPFEGRDDWLVERLVVGTKDTSIMASPNTWVNSSHLMIPLANPSPRPWSIREGDV